MNIEKVDVMGINKMCDSLQNLPSIPEPNADTIFTPNVGSSPAPAIFVTLARIGSYNPNLVAENVYALTIAGDRPENKRNTPSSRAMRNTASSTGRVDVRGLEVDEGEAEEATLKPWSC